MKKITGHEEVAAGMEVRFDRGENLMMKFSPLDFPEEKNKEERRIWYYYLLFLPVALLAVVLQIVCWVVSFCFLPSPKQDDSREEYCRKGLKKLRGRSLFFGWIHWMLAEVHYGVTTARALHAIYAAPIVFRNVKGMRDRIARFWFLFPPAMGLRNRLKWVCNTTTQHLDFVAKKRQSIKMLSLASGSADGLIAAVKSFKEAAAKFPDVCCDLTLVLVDLNEKTLLQAEATAKECGLSVSWGECKEAAIQIRATDLKEFLESVDDDQFDIIEFIGFLDYLDSDGIKQWIRKTVPKLKEDGVLLVSFTLMTVWWPVIRWIVGWIRLVYRSQKSVTRTMSSAVEGIGVARVFPEACKQHALVEIRRCR